MAENDSAFYDMLERRKKIGRLDSMRQFLKWRKDAEGVEASPRDDFGEEVETDISEVIDERNREIESIGEELDKVDPTEFETDDSFDREEKQAIYREVKREYEMATAAPELEHDIEKLESRLDQKWENAESFKEVKDDLQQLVELKRDYADEIGYDDERYEVFFNRFEPHLDLQKADNILSQLKDDLTEFIDQVDTDRFDADTSFEEILSVEDMDEEQHLEFQENLLYMLGLDPEKTPIANASHGLEGGHMYSTPTLVDVNKLLPLAAKTAIHEGGHQEYRQGLGKEDDTKYLFTPLGEPASHLVDESLARFWENHVGRTEEFAEFIAPRIKDHFGLEENDEKIAEAFHGELNSFNPDNLNRIQADEATYHLHILTRYDIERELINGNIEVDDVPGEWQDRMDEYLGVAPDDEEVLGKENGVMQDPHWFRGKFGYFPQYTLGTMLSAQLENAMEEDIGDIEQKISEGEYQKITEWLDEEVHQYGKQYPTMELIEEATGEELDPEYMLETYEEKFLEEDEAL